MKCDQPESHARIAVFGRPDGSLSDIRNGRTCQYGMKHDAPASVTPPGSGD